MITLYHFYFLITVLSKIFWYTLISYAIFNVQFQCLSIDNKIVEDYSLIQGSINNWMISNCYWLLCLRPGIENFIMTLRLFSYIPRKEVIQPHLPVRLPCYDFTPVTNPALGRCLQKVSSRTSGVIDFHGVTGGVYKTRERIQRSVLICVY